MHLLDRKELFDLASFLRALDERGRGRCVRHRSGNNELHSSSLPRPSLTRGRPFLPLSLFSVCAGVIRYEAANKSNKRVGGAVTGDTTYDVNLPPLLPPFQPSLYRSTSPRPPRDSICQLVSGDSFNPWPGVSSCWPTPSRPSVSPPHPCFRAIPRVLLKYRFPGSEGRIENVRTWNLHRASSLVTLAR